MVYAKRRVARVIALTDEMITRFGGVDALADEWEAAFREARAAGKQHLLQRYYLALLDLIAISDESKPAPEEMTDEELEMLLLPLVQKLITQQPEIVLWAAQECPGWEVIPPHDQERNPEDE